MLEAGGGKRIRGPGTDLTQRSRRALRAAEGRKPASQNETGNEAVGSPEGSGSPRRSGAPMTSGELEKRSAKVRIPRRGETDEAGASKSHAMIAPISSCVKLTNSTSI